jgi:putative peptidoglycan lipid II flippase
MGYLARALGLARDVAIAAIFRADETDSFFLAFTVPQALRQLLAEGATSRAVVPVLSKRLAREGEESARALFARLRGAFIVTLLLVTAAGVLLADPITRAMAPGYAARYGQLARTVALTRTLFPYLLLGGMAALGVAALHVSRRLDAVRAAPAITSVCLLLAALTLPDLLDLRGIDRTQALAAGVLLGAAVQIVVQLPALRRSGFRGPAIVDLRDPGVRDVARRISPLVVAVAPHYAELVLSRRFLSELGLGAQSWFSWATRICDTPHTLFAVALAAAAGRAVPDAADAAPAVARSCFERLRLVLFVALPSGALFAVLAHPVVTALFQHGAFGAHDATETARALVWQACAIPVLAAARPLASAAYALRDTRSPIVSGVLGGAAFLATALALRGRLGHTAISAALLASSIAQAITLLVALRRVLPLGRPRAALAAIGRTALASGCATVVGLSAAWLLSAGAPISIPTAHLFPGVLGTVLFVATFFIAARGLRSSELAAILGGGAAQRPAR